MDNQKTAMSLETANQIDPLSKRFGKTYSGKMRIKKTLLSNNEDISKKTLVSLGNVQSRWDEERLKRNLSHEEFATFLLNSLATTESSRRVENSSTIITKNNQGTEQQSLTLSADSNQQSRVSVKPDQLVELCCQAVGSDCFCGNVLDFDTIWVGEDLLVQWSCSSKKSVNHKRGKWKSTKTSV